MIRVVQRSLSVTSTQSRSACKRMNTDSQAWRLADRREPEPGQPCSVKSHDQPVMVGSMLHRPPCPEPQLIATRIDELGEPLCGDERQDDDSDGNAELRHSVHLQNRHQRSKRQNVTVKPGPSAINR